MISIATDTADFVIVNGKLVGGNSITKVLFDFAMMDDFDVWEGPRDYAIYMRME